ncbi:hypothetical protein [Reichenbachiella agariperforans]|uniref:hypothetical protein n=1 Tax=Reichenbachiella agariperforans TaxID=156994 RepID=UPI000934944B|nr:hypothetical protein [Reichenbachiella agariperforans]MBU2913226.1 hypothetical protein [Reichenbachiella agariperforans]
MNVTSRPVKYNYCSSCDLEDILDGTSIDVSYEQTVAFEFDQDDEAVLEKIWMNRSLITVLET